MPSPSSVVRTAMRSCPCNGSASTTRLSALRRSVLPLADQLPPFIRREPARRLLHYMCRAEQRLLLERTADQLQPERQAASIKSGRNRDARKTGHVHGDREDVVEV